MSATLTVREHLSGRRRRLWVGLGLVAAALVALAVVLQRPESVTHTGPGGAVTWMFESLRTGSCADYWASTTPRHRGDAYIQIEDCDALRAAAAEFDALEPVTVEVTGEVLVARDIAEIETLETYREGSAGQYELVVVYRVLLVDGHWLVDHLDLGRVGAETA